MIKLSVIIPNLNGKDLLESCLKSLENQTFENFEIILVDNNDKAIGRGEKLEVH